MSNANRFILDQANSVRRRRDIQHMCCAHFLANVNSPVRPSVVCRLSVCLSISK